MLSQLIVSRHQSEKVVDNKQHRGDNIGVIKELDLLLKGKRNNADNDGYQHQHVICKAHLVSVGGDFDYFINSLSHHVLYYNSDMRMGKEVYIGLSRV